MFIKTLFDSLIIIIIDENKIQLFHLYDDSITIRNLNFTIINFS